MLYRINLIVLSLGACLVAAGLAAADSQSGGRLETLLVFGEYAKPWILVTALLGLFPALSWSAFGIARLFRGGKPFWGGAAAAGWFIVMANLTFWAGVQSELEPVNNLFEKGRLVSIGDRAYLFGHGYWRTSDGYWQHQTLVRLPDGKLYHGPTLDLLDSLHAGGAASVWGSWCYSGNYPYIRMDLVTGKRDPWPSYVSYNRDPGVTIPVWLGSSFVRLGWPKDRYNSEPATSRSLPRDTLLLTRPSMDRIEQAFSVMQKRIPGLPRPDSVSWRPIEPDTVHSMTRLALGALPLKERREVRAWEKAAVREQTKTGLALYWIGGRALPLSVSVSARLHRTFEELPYGEPYGQTADRERQAES